MIITPFPARMKSLLHETQREKRRRSTSRGVHPDGDKGDAERRIGRRPSRRCPVHRRDGSSATDPLVPPEVRRYAILVVVLVRVGAVLLVAIAAAKRVGVV